MAFHKSHYSANLMKLAALGKLSLDQLQTWVEELFSCVPNRRLERLQWHDVPAQTGEELCTQVFVKSVIDQNMLDMSFPYPDEEDLYASQPGRYISYLIGHEGSGSILSYLKSKDWATGLDTGIHAVCPGTSFLSIRIHLTTEGLRNNQEVTKSVFRYIAVLKEHGPSRQIAEELATLAGIKFRFRQKTSASRTVSQLSGLMQKPVPRCWLLSGQSLIREFDPEGTRRGLDSLRPENFRFMVVSRTFPGGWNSKERWYGTEYKFEKIGVDFMSEIKAIFLDTAGKRCSELHLPAKNEFIPRRLDVERGANVPPSLRPRLVCNDDTIRLWFKKDDRLWVPKANLNILLRIPVVDATPLATILTRLYVRLVDDSLSEYSYDAEIAGLLYNISTPEEGFEISISGYNDKLHVLLKKVLHSMCGPEIKQSRFDVIKERLIRELDNFDYREHYRQIGAYSRWLCKVACWTTHELLGELLPVTAEDVGSFVPKLWQQLYAEILAHGNLKEEEASDLAIIVRTAFRPQSFPPSQWRTTHNLVLPPDVDYFGTVPKPEYSVLLRHRNIDVE